MIQFFLKIWNSRLEMGLVQCSPKFFVIEILEWVQVFSQSTTTSTVFIEIQEKMEPNRTYLIIEHIQNDISERLKERKTPINRILSFP